MPEIDALSVKITSSAKSASNGINSLVSTLEKLKKATAGATGLENTTKGLSELSLALKILDSSTASRLKELAEGMSALKAVSGIKLSPSLPKAIGEIITAAKGLTIEDTVNLKMLAPAIASLSAANDVKISSTIGSSLSTIVTAMKGIEPAGINNLRNFANAAGALSSLNGIKISSSIGNQLASIGAAVELLNSTPLNLDIVQNIADAVAPLANVGKANMTPAINQLKKIPEVARELEKVDVARFKQTVQEIANAMAPLAQELDKIGRAFSNFPNQLNRVATLTNNLTGVNTKAKRSFTEFLSAAKIVFSSLKAGASVFGGLIKNVNTYIEDVNLFQASMGEYADAAGRYADKVAEVMGIDPAMWMRNQGVFMTLATGFGVAGDRAYIMSQQLTQLGYDLSSFFNLDVDDAMQKLQSGLSGELEPLRRLGYDLSQARLQAIAFSLGIDKAYSSMTQAEKSQLRYYAIMTQVTTAQGDMARTLEAPANQIRIFSAQVTQAARALGSALIPMLNKILPYAIAAAKAIRILAASIASLFGFELPEVDYSGITGTTGAVDDLTNSLDGAGGSAKKLKSYLMGFDELNVIDPNSGSGGGGGGGIGGITGDDFDFDLPQYDFIGDAITTQVDKIMAKWQPAIEWVQAHLDEILTIGKAIGAAFALWKIATGFNPSINSLIGDLTKMRTIVGAIATSLITFTLSYTFTNDYLEYGEWEYLVADAITVGLGTAITALSMGKTFGADAGWWTAGAMLSVDATLSAVQIFESVKDKGLTKSTFLESLKTVLTGALAGAFIAKGAGLSIAGGTVVGAMIALGVTIALTVAAFEIYEKKSEQPVTWGDKNLTPESVKKLVESMFDFDISARISIVENTIANREEALTALRTAIVNVQTELGFLEISAKIDGSETAMDNLKTQAEALIPALQEHMGESQQTLSLAVSLINSDLNADGSVDLSGLIGASLTADSIIMTAMNGLGNQMALALEGGINGQLDADTMQMVADIASWMTKITSAYSQGQIEAQYQMSLDALLRNADSMTFEEIMTQYAAITKEYTDAMSQLNEQTIFDMTGRIAALDVVIAMATENGDATLMADAQAARDQLEAAKQEWISQNYIGAMTETVVTGGEVRIAQAFADMFSEALGSIESDDLASGVYGWLDNVFAKIVGATIPSSMSGDAVGKWIGNLQDRFKRAMEKAFGDDYAFISQFETDFGISGWQFLTPDVQTELRQAMIDYLESAGIPEMLAKTIVTEAGFIVGDSIVIASEGIAPEVEAGASEMTDEFWQQVDAGLAQDPYDIPETMADVVEDASTAATEAVEHMTGGPGDAYMERMSNSITEGGADAVAAAEGVTKAIAKALFGAVEGTDTKGGSGSAYKGITNEWSGIAGWFEASVTDPIAASFGNMRSDMEGTFRNVKSMFQSQWSGISGWFASNVARPMVNSLKNAGWYDAGREAAQGIKRGLDSVELPKFHLDWNTVTKKVEETTINLPILDLKFYARGGFPTAGQMFVARESGPELVGRIGNRSAVANNDQIVAGIEEGVYRAVTAAMSDSDNNINVTVYLDGKQLYRNQQQVARATGYSFAK